MHNIEKHIKSLLIEEDSVSLPGIGGFIKQYIEADISKLKKNISPPLKTIAFNKFLGDQNDLLLNRIREKEEISEEAARQKLDAYLQELQKYLDEHGRADIEGVGRLEKSPSGEVKFVNSIPDEELADNFGLSLLQIDVPEATGQVETPKPPEMEIPEHKPRKKSYTPILVIAIVIVLLAPVIYFVWVNTDIFNTSDRTNLTEEVEHEVEQIEQEQKRYADSIDQELEKKLDALTQKGSALKPEADSDNYYDQFNRFYLVAGSFRKREFASRFKQELLNKGYADAEIISSNGFFRVTITSYTNRKLTLEKLEELRRDYNSNVWVLSI